jgi:hypothetical protein
MIALLALPLDDVSQVLARADAFLAKNVSFEAEYKFSGYLIKSEPVKLRIDKPDRVRFWANLSLSNYEVSSTEKGWLDVEHRDKVYDDPGVAQGIGLRDSRLSQAFALAFPRFLISPNFSTTVPGEKERVLTRNAKIGNLTGDQITYDMKQPGTSVQYKVLIGADGNVLYYMFKVQSMSGNQEGTWELSKFTAKKFQLSDFVLRVPDDYAPVTVPGAGSPLEAESKFYFGKWKQGSQTVDLTEKISKQATLIALLDAAKPSSDCESALKALEAKGIKVLRINGLTGEGRLDLPTDPTGADLRKLNPPALPFFILRKTDGVLKRYWMGYDPAESKAWQDDVISATKLANGSKD